MTPLTPTQTAQLRVRPVLPAGVALSAARHFTGRAEHHARAGNEARAAFYRARAEAYAAATKGREA